MNKNCNLELLLIAIVLVLSSCSKEPLQNVPKDIESQSAMQGVLPIKDLSLGSIKERNGMLVFQSIEHFFKATEDISRLNNLERLSFERNLKFNSFGTIADRFYDNIDFEKFKDDNTLRDFVSRNSNMLMLENKGELGDLSTFDRIEEISILPADFFDTERWLMNKDKMYIIGNGIYKHFNDGMVVATPANPNNNVNIEKLKNASLDSWKTFENNKDFFVYKYDITDENVLSPSTIANIIPIPDQPAPPNNNKRIERIGYDKSGKYRIRVIMKCGIRSHYKIFSKYPSGHSIRLSTTVINERKGKMLIFFTKWYNTHYYTNGNVNVDVRYCGFNTVKGNYDDIILRSAESLDINYSLKDNTWQKHITFIPVPPIDIKAKKPWIRIIDWRIKLNVENGAYLNQY